MLDEQLRTAGRQLEDSVALPDVDSLMKRGRHRRGRQELAVAAVACVLTVLGLTAGSLGLDALGIRSERMPAISPDKDVTPLPMEPPILEAGTYAVPLWRETTPAEARLTVPSGWDASEGVYRGFRGGGSVAVTVMDVDRVTTVPCRVYGNERGPGDGMKAVGNTPEALVRALVGAPGQTVVTSPARVEKFGESAVHLTLDVRPDAQCSLVPLQLWSGAGDGSQTADPGARMDLWVVDVSGEAALVAAITDPGAPAWLEQQTQEVVDSVQFAE
jgi:hypothetical protein